MEPGETPFTAKLRFKYEMNAGRGVQVEHQTQSMLVSMDTLFQLSHALGSMAQDMDVCGGVLTQAHADAEMASTEGRDLGGL